MNAIFIRSEDVGGGSGNTVDIYGHSTGRVVVIGVDFVAIYEDLEAWERGDDQISETLF